MKIVQIFKDGSMNDLECKFNLRNCCKVLTEHSKSHGNNALKELFKWNYEDSTIHLYGWYDGEAGFENKHDLVPGGQSKFLDEDSSVQLLFGDISLFQKKKKKVCDFLVSDYADFYNFMFGGFDNCESETDEEEMNTESEDEDYKPPENDNDDDEDEYIHSGEDEDELEEDITEYD